MKRTAILLTVLALAGFTPAATSAVPDDSVVLGFDGLEEHIAGLEGFPRGRRLLAQVEAAEASYRRGKPCAAAHTLRAYLNSTAAGRREAPDVAEDLLNRGWGLRLDVLATATSSDPCSGEDGPALPAVQVITSDVEHLVAEVTFPLPRLSTIQRGDETWTRAEIPGLAMGMDTFGLPEIPVLHEAIAVPHGARATIVASPVEGETLAMNLFPLQEGRPMGGHTPDHYYEELPPDEVFAEPPFVKDEAAYARPGAEPSNPCTLGTPGSFRDLRIADLSCAAATYDPVADELVLYRSLRFEVRFAGGDAAFATEASLGSFEPDLSVLSEMVLNRDVVPDHLKADIVPRICQGEELLIFTRADLAPYAEQLSDWKESRGIVTTVIEVNDGPGPAPDTPHAIRAVAGQRYEDCLIRPSYVLLFGDAEHVPTFYPQNPVYPEKVIASDHPYTIHQQFAEDWGFDFAVGRLPVDEPHAQGVVDKIVGYEDDPPLTFGFYGRASIASQFECCQIDDDPSDDVVPPDGADQRAFIKVVEDVRTRLSVHGWSVDRIYTETVDGEYEGDPTPLLHANWSSLPSDLLPPFPWPGETADILDDLHEGRALMIHLDHGGKKGWSHPRLLDSDVSAATNGELLPFVLGFNCSSGFFDNETDFPNDPELTSDPTSDAYQSFSEALIRNPNGGAVGTIAGTRTTFGHGNIMIKGALDSAIPGMDPAVGDMTANPRFGDMLNHARLYMLIKYGGGTNTQRHFLLYNLLGDPTTPLWTDTPFRLPQIVFVDARPEFLHVIYRSEGAEVTAYQETREGVRAIGRGTIRDGEARLAYVTEPLPGVPIMVAANAENAVPASMEAREGGG